MSIEIPNIFNVHTASGMQISVKEWGNKNNPVCVVVHGFGEGAYVWEWLAKSLSSEWRIVAVDLRGHGDSSWDPQGRYALEDYISDLNNIIEVMGLYKIALVGHSLGGAISIEIAAMNKFLIESIVIVDFGIGLSSEGQDRALADFMSSFRPFRSIMEYRGWIAETRPLTSPLVLDDIVRKNLRKNESDEYVIKCDPALISYANKHAKVEGVIAALREIQCPSLLVRGAGSAVFPHRSAILTVERLLNGELSTISGAGHAVIVENPEEFAQKAKSFLDRHRSRV